MTYKEAFEEIQDEIEEIIGVDDIDFTNDVEFWVNPVDYLCNLKSFIAEQIWDAMQEKINIIEEEEEIAHNMDSDYCELSYHGCDDCYIPECSSSACI